MNGMLWYCIDCGIENDKCMTILDHNDIFGFRYKCKKCNAEVYINPNGIIKRIKKGDYVKEDEFRDKMFNLMEMIAKKLVELLDYQIKQSKGWSEPIESIPIDLSKVKE